MRFSQLETIHMLMCRSFLCPLLSHALQMTLSALTNRFLLSRAMQVTLYALTNRYFLKESDGKRLLELVCRNLGYAPLRAPQDTGDMAQLCYKLNQLQMQAVLAPATLKGAAA